MNGNLVMKGTLVIDALLVVYRPALKVAGHLDYEHREGEVSSYNIHDYFLPLTTFVLFT